MPPHRPPRGARRHTGPALAQQADLMIAQTLRVRAKIGWHVWRRAPGGQMQGAATQGDVVTSRGAATPQMPAPPPRPQGCAWSAPGMRKFALCAARANIML